MNRNQPNEKATPFREEASVGIDGGLPTAVGRVSKTFGQNGELVVSLYDTFPYEQAEGECIYVEIDGIWTPFFFGTFRRRGRSKAVAVFDDMDTENRARELVGRELFLFSETEEIDAVPQDEIDPEDLVGYTVRISGQPGEGQVLGYIEHDFNPLFEVKWRGEPILIPVADEFIVSVDESTRELVFDLPEGLLEL